MSAEIDPKVVSFIASYSDKLWNRMVRKGHGFKDPLTFSLVQNEGFAAAFEVVFEREPSNLEMSTLLYHICDKHGMKLETPQPYLPNFPR